MHTRAIARFRHRRLSTRIFAFQALILVFTLLLGCLLALRASQRRLDEESEHRALAVAQSVAAQPEIARAVAEPLSKTQGITIVSTDGLGASKVTADVAKIVAELPAVVEGLSGVDLKRLVQSLPGLKRDGGGKRTEE